MVSIFYKAVLIWLLMVIAAIINGALRDRILALHFDSATALAMSGIMLSLLVFVICYLFIGYLGQAQQHQYILIGLFWVCLTLGLELGFGHYVLGKSWAEIMQVFNIRRGDLFLLVLIVSIISPWLSAKFKGLI